MFATYRVTRSGRAALLVADQRWQAPLALSRSWGSRKVRLVTLRLATALLVPLLIASGALAVRTALPVGSPRLSVIVRTVSGTEGSVERTVQSMGGSVDLELPLIGGFAATIPAASVPALLSHEAVVEVTPNGRVQAQSDSYEAASDSGSMLNVTKMTGAQDYWAAGYTGAGVDVAVIDTGVSLVDGLDADKVLYGPDISFESQSDTLKNLDGYGHGTHMAGIIAGRGDGAVPGSYVGDDTNFLGMAPDARIVSVKVGDSHGFVDVSQVIAAIGWVVQHRYDNGMNVRVLNISFGTNSTQDYVFDPLAFAAEIAWRRGLVVVVAAGNAGFAADGSLTNPAVDPYVLAVGATDPMGTNDLSDDTVASFSSSGKDRNPDLVAPGAHIVSLRDPGSYIDNNSGSTGAVTDTLFRGSGTSQAAAVVSGAAALLIQQRPEITPDQVKGLLQDTSVRLANTGTNQQGSGELNLANALGAPVPDRMQNFSLSRGTGSLNWARGSVRVSRYGVNLYGERDIFGHTFDADSISNAIADGNSWSGGSWNGNSWSGNSWSGNRWRGNSWSALMWSGNSWSGNWFSNSWSGNTWSGNSWSGNSWSSNSWSGDSWSSNSWS
jgi:serine protease AprX